MSPPFAADDIRMPLLVTQGANDPRVLKEESNDIDLWSGVLAPRCQILSLSKATPAQLPPFLDEVIVVLPLVLRGGHPRQPGLAQQSLIG